ncbi:uncharacterized protein LOC114277938 [Camellia sinensis]|uniref:uncharacterized protein LOC114277938 n=1 Tax=Camellia sinensis TaxID=4442 RepID=UPI001036EDEE|nr:uncharacterized protein LOC114277938 [Camellia sinensis]
MVPETPKETEQYARGFLMFLFGTTLFADRGNTVRLYLLSALVDLSQVHRYDWGGAGLATLYFYMSATSRGRGDLLGGYWRAWELWVYVYFPALAPELEVVGIPMTPYSLVFEGPHRPRPRETLLYLRQYFDTVRHSEITWQPWVSLGDGLRLQYTGASDISQYRVLLEGPVGRAWFLGERFLRQVWGYLSQDPPAVPPASMRTADRLSYSKVVGAMLGSDALLYVEEGDYATYRHIYLMPPLTGARTSMTSPAVKMRKLTGLRFGFVRYDCPVAAEVAVQRADGLWCDDKEIKVKRVKFTKEERSITRGDKVSHQPGGNPQGMLKDSETVNIGVQKVGILRWRDYGGSKSYVEVIRNGSSYGKEEAIVQVREVGNRWLYKSLVVKLHKFFSFPAFKEECKKRGLMKVQVRAKE